MTHVRDIASEKAIGSRGDQGGARDPRSGHDQPRAAMLPPMVDHSPPSPAETFVGTGLDTWAGSPFVQARLGLLGKTVFLLSFGFFAIMNCVMILGAGTAV